MGTFRRFRLLAAPSVAAVIALAGCGNEGLPQEPTGGNDAPSSGGATPERLTLDELDPCGLLSDAEAVDYGYQTRENATVGPPACTYRNGATAATLTISFSDDGLDALRPPADVTLMTSGKRNGRRYVEIQAKAEPRCAIVLEIEKSQTVSVQSNRPTMDSYAACQHADIVTERIESALP